MAALHMARMVHIYTIFLLHVFAPVSPTWSEWSVWSSCPATCGTVSTKKAYRSCLSGPCPPVAVGVTNEKTAPCGLLDCDCHPWDAWSAWGPCVQNTCSKKRTRTCTNTAGGRCPCLGISSQDVPCVILPYCCEPPEWNTWQRWSECNSTCLQRRARACMPASDFCRNYICPGENWQEQSCNGQHCCHARWGEWGAWSRCSGACLRGRNRTCIACPQSTCTGGDNRREEACEDGDCCPAKISAESTWLSWSNWVLCSATCGQGRSSRQRSCASPKCKCESVKGQRLFDETQTVMCTSGCCAIDAAGAAVQSTGKKPWGHGHRVPSRAALGSGQGHVGARMVP
ncbi:properdin-like isoform X1 [Littorina saxatilis]|uniref:properdin-like isoform X1 n=1 Tax=Littorina saxatilis TaxID=31220 RepID=UPI0038B660A9